MRNIGFVIFGLLLVGWVGMAAAADDESKCRAGRAAGKGAYEACVQKVFAKAPGITFLDSDQIAKLDKCVAKYAALWTKLQGLIGSASCGGLARFVDNGTTVTDRLTLLTWEKKSGAADDGQNYSDPRDPDNYYALTFDNDDDGSIYNDFLEKLNTGTGFADANSWRVPTLSELLTIRNQPEIGVFYPSWYWSRSLDQTDTSQAWRIHFGASTIMTAPKWSVSLARAVRGGL